MPGASSRNWTVVGDQLHDSELSNVPTRRSLARVFPLIVIVIVADQRGLASGPQFVNADNIGVPEHIADPHIDPGAFRSLTQAPQKFFDEPLSFLFLGQVGHWDFSGYLRRRSAASSVRSTLLGEAGWHRADFAEARTLDDGRFYGGGSGSTSSDGPPWAADQFT
jgi:hypothetical protein